jgi:hypothetical protein
MGLNNVRTKVKSGLANVSFFLGLVGGILASLSMIGGWIQSAVGILPWWGPIALFTIFFLVCLGDWAEDAIPNRPAVYTAMIWPSLFIASLTGKPGAKLLGAIGAIDEKYETDLAAGVKDWTDLTGDLENAFTVFSLIGIVAAITYAQRYAKKSKGGGAATISTGTNTPPVVSRRGR